MQFVDQAKIHIRAGQGGDGCRSFYRDKYRRYGIPDGGDGGEGADIIIQADKSLYTLLDFKYNPYFRAADGAHGSGKNKKGKDADNLIIRVPIGTIVQDAKSNCVLRDLDIDGASVVVAKGGKGGQGNRGGREKKPGLAGEEKDLILDLKLIADVGLVGLPNTGKSTLISAISNARPQIAAYPFTTKSPVLGAVDYKDSTFVAADVPGLIKGSYQGKGLGDRFLRHIERTKIILHIIDMAGSEGRQPLEDYKNINKELSLYSQETFDKPQILVANKMDLEGAEDNLKAFKRQVRKKIYPISALKKQGLEALLEAITKRLQKTGN